jgi:hypothetical protein
MDHSKMKGELVFVQISDSYVGRPKLAAEHASTQVRSIVTEETPNKEPRATRNFVSVRKPLPPAAANGIDTVSSAVT